MEGGAKDKKGQGKGLEDGILVVRSVAAYVAKALAIAHQPKLRALLASEIMRHRHRLFSSSSIIGISCRNSSSKIDISSSKRGDNDAIKDDDGDDTCSEKGGEESEELQDWQTFIFEALA